MTILIRGMEMPDNCYGCPLSEQREETDMGARFTYMVDCKKNSFDDGTFEGRRKTRPDWCPLIEVPTPHGRLIDADVLKDRIDEADAWVLGAIDRSSTVIEADTKADRIRAMADEELADLLCDHACMLCPLADNCGGRMEIGRTACYERWLDWLKQEVNYGD